MVLLSALSLILVVLLGGAGYALWLNSQLKRTELPKDDNSLGISSEFQQDDSKWDDVTNIILFGLDRRGQESCRSDSMIVLTVDRKNNLMKATSLLRDPLVEVEGHGTQKLAHAFLYGGPELAIKTINQSFGLNIRDYVAVNFDEMAKIVDAVGGVTIDVQKNEIASANESIQEYCRSYGVSNPTLIKSAGEQTLNGMQACGYSRVRHAGNGDDRERTDRQRRVIEQVFQKALKMNPLEYPGLAANLLPMMETSLSTGDILSLGTSVMTSGSAKFQQARFPMNVDLWEDNSTSNGSAIAFNEKITKEKLHDFIFNNIDPDTWTSSSSSSAADSSSSKSSSSKSSSSKSSSSKSSSSKKAS